jgi:hypothetical protein
MLKRLVATGAVVGVVALTAGAVGPAMGNGGHHHGNNHGDRIRVLSTNTEENFVDTGDAGPSLGDQFVFSSQLTKKGRTVGHTGVVCTITSVTTNESQCNGTAWFDRAGQIAIQGLVAGEPEQLEFPIIGGTGKFEGAGGTLKVREVSDTVEELTFKLS